MEFYLFRFGLEFDVVLFIEAGNKTVYEELGWEFCYAKGIGANIEVMLAYLDSDLPELTLSFGSISFKDVWVFSLT